MRAFNFTGLPAGVRVTWVTRPEGLPTAGGQRRTISTAPLIATAEDACGLGLVEHSIDDTGKPRMPALLAGLSPDGAAACGDVEPDVASDPTEQPVRARTSALRATSAVPMIHWPT